jgi:hypothetical protein
MTGASGVAFAVLDVRGALATVERLPGEGVRLRRTDGGVVDHLSGGSASSWRVARDGGAPVTLMTAEPARVAPPGGATVTDGGARTAPERLMPGTPWSATLGAEHYRGSEQSWDEAGRPHAHLAITADARRVHLTVQVTLNRPTTFVPADSDNPLDNERAEINGDGVELFVVPAGGPDAGRLAGWLLVPGDARTVRVIPTSPAAASIRVQATAVRTAEGYRMTVEIARADLLADDGDVAARTVALDLLVNEMPADRERRRGQLVLSGARGGFVYLQGDRHEAARCLPFVLPPSADR